MKHSIVFFFSLGIGCATPSPIALTKYNSPIYRVMVDPESISKEQYVRLIYALKQSNRFIVVDRANGFQAAKREQEIQNGDERERFGNRDKYAHWGKLYGVRGIVVAHVDCRSTVGMFVGNYFVCDQDLQLIDANTGEILAVANAISEGGSGMSIPHWASTVETLNNNIKIETRKDTALSEYEAETERRSLTQESKP